MQVGENDEVLANFQAITGLQTVEECEVYLSRFEWNLEAALNSYFINQSEQQQELQEEEIPTTPSTQSHLTRRNVSSSSASSPPQPPSPTTTQTNETVQSSLLNAIIRFFSSASGQESHPADPEQAFRQFLIDYEAKYGTSEHPEFFAGSYIKALDKARRDLSFAFVYLHSPDHDDTDTFCQTVLNTPQFSSFMVEKNCILWAGSVYHPEAYRAIDTLQITSFPSLSLICLKNGRMQLVHRLNTTTDLPVAVESVLNELTVAVDEHGGDLIVERTERAERDMARRIREEQDRAYQESLRKDREKEKLRVQAEEEERRLLELEKQKAEEMERRMRNQELMKEELKMALPAEPPADGSLDICKIIFRLPDGSRVERRFLSTDTVEILYQFATTCDLKIDHRRFVICSNFPRKSFTEKSITLKDAGLFPNGMLVIEEIVE